MGIQICNHCVALGAGPPEMRRANEHNEEDCKLVLGLGVIAAAATTRQIRASAYLWTGSRRL